MFLIFPRVDVWIAVQLPPPFIPDTFLTSIILMINPHTVFMSSVPRWDTILACHVLMISRPKMNQNFALVRRRRFGLSRHALLGMVTF